MHLYAASSLCFVHYIQQGDYVFDNICFVCLYVGLSVSNITKKRCKRIVNIEGSGAVIEISN